MAVFDQIPKRIFFNLWVFGDPASRRIGHYTYVDYHQFWKFFRDLVISRNGHHFKLNPREPKSVR